MEEVGNKVVVGIASVTYGVGWGNMAVGAGLMRNVVDGE